MAKTNEHMKVFMKARYHERRKLMIDMLGGKCVKCGRTKNLQFDHVDRKTKTMSFDRMTMVCMARFLAEVALGQLLCDDCHTEKTLADLGRTSAKGTHGTLSSMRYCKCELCREVKNKYSREWKARKRQGHVIQSPENSALNGEVEG